MRGRQEEERVRAKQSTSVVLTLVNESSPSAKIRYDNAVRYRSSQTNVLSII